MDPDAPTTTASSTNGLQLPLAPATSAATGLLPAGELTCIVFVRLAFFHYAGGEYATSLPFASGLGDYSAYSAAYPYNMAMPTYNQYTTTYNFMGAFVRFSCVCFRSALIIEPRADKDEEDVFSVTPGA